MKIFLLNDTATVPHIGCQAVSDGHARLLGAAGHEVIDRAFLGELLRFATPHEDQGIASVLADDELRSRIEACDALVVNGEGTLHHGFGSEYFACLGAAQRMGKVTIIVNAVFEHHSGWEKTIGRLDDFCVRDVESLRHAAQHGFVARLVPDSFMAASFDGDANINLRGQIVVTDWHPQRDPDVGAAMRTILDKVEGTFYYPMQHGMHSHLWRSAVEDWTSADVIITGRHHGIYLAARARKPFVALPSNTRKVQGLIEASGANIPVVSSVDGIMSAFEYATDNLDQYERLFNWLDAQNPLTTFRALGKGTGDPEVEVRRLQEQIKRRGLESDTRFWSLRNGSAETITST